MFRKMIVTAAFLTLSAFFASAQAPQALPCDPEVKTGKLANGMTYYIRHNDKPAQRAEFYLATNVGAIQETPDQDGLAHFLEHMCFNGLKNLPGKQMLDYLQHIGAEFGRNINASTGVEHTQYMLNNIPVTREGILDTCLLVMHDYSHFVLNDPAEIDAERGVILEEKRTRNTASWRMFEKSAPLIYGEGSKYDKCNIIGSEENLKNFKPESLVNFYQTWYRPDMQALIIVGDIDVEQVYDKVVKLFADIPAPETPTVKHNPEIKINDTPVVGVITDPENSSEEISMILRLHEPLPKETKGSIQGYIIDVAGDIFYSVMRERFNDISQNADAPILGGYAVIADFCETMEMFQGSVTAKNGQSLEAAKLLFTEIEKARRYGLSDSEVERAKENMLKSRQNSVEKASSRKNSEFIRPIINNFFNGTPYMVPETELMLSQAIFPKIDAATINKMVAEMLASENPIIILEGIDKPGQNTPTEDKLLAAYSECRKAEIQANKVEEFSRDFMAGRTIKPGKVKKTATGDYETTVWTLSNGLTVKLLHTDYNKNQVLFKLVKEGGKSLIPDRDIASFDDNIMGQFSSNSGIAEFPNTTATKMLSGKTVSVKEFIGSSQHGISGNCAPADMETALQITNLMFTTPRFDENEWNLGISQINSVLDNLMTNPDYICQQRQIRNIYGANPRKATIDKEILSAASLSTYESYYRKLFADVAGATLYVVGNITPETLKPLVEKYCASLPKGKKASSCNLDLVPKYAEGNIVDEFTAKMETPKVNVFQIHHAPVSFSMQKSVAADAADFILNMIYVTTLREEEGGTYGAGVSISLQYYPRQTGHAIVVFDTNEEKQQKLRELALDGLKKLAEEGPTEEQMTRAVENARKNLPEKRISNGYWMNALQYNDRTGGNYDKEYGDAIASLTAEDVRSIVKEIIEAGNFIEVVMGPEAK